MRLLLIFLLQFLLVLAFSQDTQQDSMKVLKSDWKFDSKIDEHATYEMGWGELLSLVAGHIDFPKDEDSECNKRTKVAMNIMIDDSGRVEQVRVIRSICPEVDNQYVNVIKGIKFRPAMKNGKPVRDVIYMPIQICLRAR